MSKTVNITINNKKIKADKGKTILEICRENNIFVPTMCEMEIIEPFGSCRLCLVEINMNGSSSVVTSCSTYVENGMIVKTYSDEVKESRKMALELLLSEHYGDCIGPCKKGCPLHYDVPTYVGLIADGKMKEALKLIKDSTPVAYSLGCVCPAFCEDECRRQKVEETIAIRLLKKAVAEMDMNSDNPYIPEVCDEKEEKIAIVGGGPAGLTAATQLRRKGYKVTIFEAQKKLGGMLRYGIPEFRLPKEMLDKEIELALKIGGINVKYNTELGKDITLEELSSEYDAVFIGTGAWVDRIMSIEGEDLKGSYTGIKFLYSIANGEEIHLGDKVIVIGGGNTAMDVARTARRLGSDVKILYRRSRKEMPADEKELKEAEEEGIEFKTLTNITAILGNNKVEGVRCIKMELGEPDESGRRRPIPIEGSEYKINADSVIMAIGQYGDIKEMKDFDIECGKSWIDADLSLLTTNKENIFAGGDIVLGPSTIVESSAQAKRAAKSIDFYLRGKLELANKIIKEPYKYIQEIKKDPELLDFLIELIPYNHEKEIDEWDLEPYEKKIQIKVFHRKPKERIKDFNKIEDNYTRDEAEEEAKRCLSCGCEALFECKLREFGTIYQTEQHEFKGELIRFRPDNRHEYIIRDQSKCILCGECINECNEILGEYAIDFVNRGFITVIEPPFGKKLECISCGACVNECPTGALEDKKTVEKPGPYPMETISTICGECGLCCPVNLRTYNDRPIRVETPHYKWNNNILCERGRYKILWDYTSGYFNYRNNKRKKIGIKKILSLFSEKEKLSLILSGDLYTNEAEKLIKIAEKYGNRVFVDEVVKKGNAVLSEINNAEKIKVGIDIDLYAPMKAIVNTAVKNGAKLVEKEAKDTVSIIHNNENINKGKALVIPRKMNSIGISSLSLPKWSGEGNISLYIGKPSENLDIDFAVIPAPYYTRKGRLTLLNGEKKETEVKIKGYDPLRDLINRIS